MELGAAVAVSVGGATVSVNVAVGGTGVDVAVGWGVSVSVGVAVQVALGVADGGTNGVAVWVGVVDAVRVKLGVTTAVVGRLVGAGVEVPGGGVGVNPSGARRMASNPAQ